MRVTDIIDVSTAASRELHGYRENGQSIEDSSLYALEGKVEGDRNGEKLSRRGMLHIGKVTFKAAVDPDNRGVVLRLLTDLSKGPMRAKVFIDGKEAGLWTLAEHNEHAPYGDSDFEIAPSFTKGKSLINVSLDPEDTLAAFEFKIISRI